MYKINTVTVLKDYQLEICFNDGVKGVVDLLPMVGRGVFKRWKDWNEFQKVYIDETSHTLIWPDGIDLAPDVLYEEVSKQKAA